MSQVYRPPVGEPEVELTSESEDKLVEHYQATFPCGCVETYYLSWYKYKPCGQSYETVSARPSRTESDFRPCSKHGMQDE